MVSHSTHYHFGKLVVSCVGKTIGCYKENAAAYASAFLVVIVEFVQAQARGSRGLHRIS